MAEFKGAIMKNYLSASLLFFLLSVSQIAASSELDAAVKLQEKSIQAERKKAIAKEKAAITNDSLEKHTQVLFQKFYMKVKKSGLKLANPLITINEINEGRRRTNYCCQIVIEKSYDNGMYVVSEGTGMFSVDGFGLTSVMGSIRDDSFESTGRISNECMYEVSMANESYMYNCQQFLSGALDEKAISDMQKMFVKSMEAYKR